MIRSLLWLAALAGAALGAPTATVKNGTYTGVSLPSFKQELFLGMPYAQQPLPPLLRLQPPRSLNTSWHGTRAATECVSCPMCGGTQLKHF
jgi:acetylcholinesterase